MRMRMSIRARLAAGRTGAVIVLAMVAIALAILRGDVAGQRSTRTAGQSPPMFTATDLTPKGFDDAHASGVSGDQQVGDAYALGTHALLWRGSAAGVVDLHPGGFEKSEAHGICGNQQVGEGRISGKVRALLWRGNASSVVDLTPRGFDAVAAATSGDQQVGNGSRSGTGNVVHALLWRGSAASVVDLHPRGFDWSMATGVSGGQQGGTGGLPSTTGYRNEHALLWRGSAASVVDLHPSGFDFSLAYGVGGEQQVGYGMLVNPAGNGKSGAHALLWRGSAASVVDLTPSGFEPYPGTTVAAVATATNGVEQVGRAGAHAVLWRGSAASVVDLHAFLPPGFQFSSAAGIDVNGNVVGYASPTGGPAPDSHAFLWRRNLPKPATSQGQSVGGCK